MPSGHHLSREMKALLIHCVRTKDYDPDFIYENVFEPLHIITKPYLIRKCAEIVEMTADDVDDYLDGKTRGKRKKKIERQSDARRFLDYIVEHHCRLTVTRIAQLYYEGFIDEHLPDAPSLSTIYRTIKNGGNTRKVINWRNIHQCPQEQLEYLARVAHIPAEYLIDVDGMVQTPKDFLTKYGWSPRGDVLRAVQIVIGDQAYAIHAAFSQRGFLEWKVFDTTVSEDEVVEFIETLRYRCQQNPNLVALFDNASNQRTEAVRRVMESVFNGRYYYCAAYSPFLKPIENGFSLIKRYIKDHYDPGRNPVDQINDAFLYYSDQPGQHGPEAAYRIFDLYRRNHAMYLQVARE